MSGNAGAAKRKMWESNLRSAERRSLLDHGLGLAAQDVAADPVLPRRRPGTGGLVELQSLAFDLLDGLGEGAARGGVVLELVLRHRQEQTCFGDGAVVRVRR